MNEGGRRHDRHGTPELDGVYGFAAEIAARARDAE